MLICNSLIVLTICILSLCDASNRISRKTINDEENINANNTPTCQKYLLLTTQRSGSTWTCELFDLQNSITCGGSKVVGPIRYSELMKSSWNKYKTWDMFETDLTNGLAEADGVNSCSSSSPGLRQAAGFKIMYNNIPKSFVENGQFVDYLLQNNVAIIHLIREAKILRVSSQSTMKEEKLTKLDNNMPHTIDQDKANMIKQTTAPFQWDNSTISMINDEESMDHQWEMLLKFTPKLKYHRMMYEKMLLKDGLEREISQVLSFLHLDQPSATGKVNLESHLLQLHKATCPGRVPNYGEFLQRIKGTRTAAACNYLDEIYGDEEAEMI